MDPAGGVFTVDSFSRRSSSQRLRSPPVDCCCSPVKPPGRKSRAPTRRPRRRAWTPEFTGVDLAPADAGTDGTRIGDDPDGTRIGGDIDGTRIGGEPTGVESEFTGVDLAPAEAGTDGTRIGSDIDGTRIGSEPTGVESEFTGVDLAPVEAWTDGTRIGSESTAPGSAATSTGRGSAASRSPRPRARGSASNSDRVRGTTVSTPRQAPDRAMLRDHQTVLSVVLGRMAPGCTLAAAERSAGDLRRPAGDRRRRGRRGRFDAAGRLAEARQ